MNYGAAGNGVADDTTAIKAAITAAAANDILYFPTGTYKVSSELLMTSPLSVLGDGKQTTLFTGTISSGALFHLQPPTGVDWIGQTFSNFGSTVICANILNIDTTAANSDVSYFSAADIFGSGTTKDCFINNGVSTNGGNLFCASIRRCGLTSAAGYSCVNLTYGGDSILIDDNDLTGNGWAVYASQTGGAGQLIISRNNITANNGIFISQAYSPIISENEMEFNAVPNNGIVIELYGDGTSNQIIGGAIRDNGISLDAGVTSISEIIYISGSTGVVVSGNRLMSNPSGTLAIGISSTATSTFIDNNNLFINISMNFYDLSSSTVYTGSGGDTASKAANGYLKNGTTGVIIQWGSVTGVDTATSPKAVSFPVAFPSVCASVTASCNTTLVASIGSITTSGFTVSVNNVGAVTVYWSAFGY
jgi:hypothetical protein